MNIGRCSITIAELWGLYQGLLMAWNGGIRSMIVEADSLCVIQLLEAQNDRLNASSPLVKSIKALLAQNWQVSVHHIYREANFAADFLATFALSLPLGLHSLLSPPPGVEFWLRSDSLGTAFPLTVKPQLLLLGSFPLSIKQKKIMPITEVNFIQLIENVNINSTYPFITYHEP